MIQSFNEWYEQREIQEGWMRNLGTAAATVAGGMGLLPGSGHSAEPPQQPVNVASVDALLNPNPKADMSHWKPKSVKEISYHLRPQHFPEVLEGLEKLKKEYIDATDIRLKALRLHYIHQQVKLALEMKYSLEDVKDDPEAQKWLADPRVQGLEKLAEKVSALGGKLKTQLGQLPQDNNR